MIRTIPALVMSLAYSAGALAGEDIHFLAEHAVESGMDAVYMALPWPAGYLEPERWQASVDLAAAHTSTEFMRLEGSVLSLAATRGVNPRWGYELVMSYGAFQLTGGDGRVPLSARFLGDVPLDLPQLADFSAVQGTQRQLSLGAAAVHERQAPGRTYSSQLIAGLLFEHVDLTPLRMDYRLGGAHDAASGTLQYTSGAGFVTPFVAWQQTRSLSPRWAWSPRAALVVPLPPRALHARLSGPQFDVSTPPAGATIEMGDPFVAVGLAFRHRPSGLEIDLGGPLYFARGETASHRGVGDARVVHVAWRPSSH